MQRNTKTYTRIVVNTVIPHMNLADALHLEEAVKDVDAPTILKECAEIVETGNKRNNQRIVPGIA